MSTAVRGVRVDPVRLKKWDTIAEQLGVSKNEAFNLLIDGAVVISKPRAQVHLNANTHNTKILADERVAGVEA